METNKETCFCQSCGMPLTDDILGTNDDGSKNHEYCIYCYKDGAFTGDFTMEQMAEYCSMFVEEYKKNTGRNLTACEYKQELLKFFPTLKRWQDNSSPRGGRGKRTATALPAASSISSSASTARTVPILK